MVETKDADQDEVQLRFRWLVNDVPLLGESSFTLNPSGTKRGDLLTVVVTPYDGKLEGTPTRAVDWGGQHAAGGKSSRAGTNRTEGWRCD